VQHYSLYCVFGNRRIESLPVGSRSLVRGLRVGQILLGELLLVLGGGRSSLRLFGALFVWVLWRLEGGLLGSWRGGMLEN